MKKSTKLLSVILAFVMILSSMTMLASAVGKKQYQTVANLNDAAAYSPYGAVTRLETEERISMLLDSLDILLGKANINLGTVINTLGLKLTIDLRSVDALLGTVDDVKTLKGKFLVSLIGWMLGIINDLDVSTWVNGVRRDTSDQMRIVYELVELIDKNKAIIANVIKTGNLDLGIIDRFVNLGSVGDLLNDIPGLVKSMILPMFERKDDDAAQIVKLLDTNVSLEQVVTEFVQGLFTKPMSTTTVKADANGNMTSDHVLPTQADGLRYYYVVSADKKTVECYVYDKEAKDGSYIQEDDFTLQPEVEGSDVYVYVQPDGSTLKYYKPESYFLPSLQASGNAADIMNISTNNAASMLYDMIPYVFQEMAPVVLNGSIKKIVAGLFGAEYVHVGDVVDGKYVAIKNADMAVVAADLADSFFTEAQGRYLWEWSNYKVINGTHYYRYEDQIFMADLSNANPCMDLFNWDWHITDDFMNQFIPGKGSSYATVLQSLNNFVGAVIDEVMSPDMIETIGWTKGDNSNLVANVVKTARKFVSQVPQTIFGNEYYKNEWYNSLMEGSNQEVLTSLAMLAIGALMPQFNMPTPANLKGKNIGAVGAMVVRELCTQLLPSYNYDALIYSDYTNKIVLDKTNSEWLDVILTMGVDLGVSYLKELADMGEDTAAWAGMGWSDSKTYAANANTKAWEDKIDYIIDWALSNQYEWCWSMENFVDTTGLTIDLATAQDPWVKIGKIFKDLLPVEDIFNVDYSNANWLEVLLRDDFVLAAMDLDITKLIGGASATGALNIPTNSVLRTDAVLPMLTTVIKNLINTLLNKVGEYQLIPDNVTTIDNLLTKANLAQVVQNLLGMLFNTVKRDYVSGAANTPGAAGTFKRDGLLTTALPIINFFIGWSTDAQVHADPIISLDTEKGDNYLLKSVSNNLKFVNNSSGMLLKHRKGANGVYDKEDKAYTIKITNVTATNGVSVSGFPTDVAPGATTYLPISVPDGDGTTKLTISYTFTGKNGVAMGGTQTAVYYAYYTSTEDQENVEVAGEDTGDYANREGYKTYNFTEKLYETVTTYTGTMTYKSATFQIGNKTKNFVSCGTLDKAFDERAAQYFEPITDRAEAGWLTKLEKDNNDYSASVGKLYKAKAGVTAETFSKANSVKNDLYGVYNMGQVATKYGNRSGTWAVQFIYINTFGVDEVMSKYIGYGLAASDFTAAGQSAFTAYENALFELVKWATYPKTTTYATDVQPNIEAAIKAIDSAYAAVMKYKKPAEVSTANLEKALEDYSHDADGRDHDYQDYAHYEYWDYEEERTDGRNIIKSVTAPEAPQKYIDKSNLSPAQIDAVIAAETNALKSAAITATVKEPTEKDLADYAETLKNWVPAEYDELYIEDIALKLGYYYGIMTQNPKAANKQFLKKEIDTAKALYEGKSALYAADSWAEYQKAYDEAVAVNNDSAALGHEVFDAKYYLMVAENNLILKEDSAKETGALSELEVLAEVAEKIFAYPQYYTMVNEDITADEAYKQLIVALGQKFTNDDGDEEILYSRSAYEFLKYDREKTSNNLAKIDAAADALQAAIDNFECTVGIVSKPNDDTTTVETTKQIIDGIEPLSIATVASLITHVQATNPDAILSTNTSKAGVMGTGARVDVSLPEIGVVTVYYVVIYGDVNGDGVIDGFDALETDLANNGRVDLEGAYKLAADANGDGVIDASDYSAITADAKCGASISQTH